MLQHNGTVQRAEPNGSDAPRPSQGDIVMPIVFNCPLCGEAKRGRTSMPAAAVLARYAAGRLSFRCLPGRSSPAPDSQPPQKTSAILWIVILAAGLGAAVMIGLVLLALLLPAIQAARRRPAGRHAKTTSNKSRWPC